MGTPDSGTRGLMIAAVLGLIVLQVFLPVAVDIFFAVAIALIAGTVGYGIGRAVGPKRQNGNSKMS